MGLSKSELDKWLEYKPCDGSFVWKIKTGKKSKVGATCGAKHSSGRIYISLNKKIYFAHRLVWLHFHGELPEMDIDHINGNCSDNRIENLRLATHAENMQNKRRARSDSTSGLIGAMPHQGKWRSDIVLAGKKFYLGVFSTMQEAHEAYVKAKREKHSFCTI